MRKYGSFWRTPMILWVSRQIGYFNSSLIQFIDLEMWYRIALKYKVGFINKSLSGFRLHIEQLSNKNAKYNNEKVLAEKLILYINLYQDLKKENINKYYMTILKI